MDRATEDAYGACLAEQWTTVDGVQPRRSDAVYNLVQSKWGLLSFSMYDLGIGKKLYGRAISSGDGAVGSWPLVDDVLVPKGLVRPGDVVVHVGASIGQVTLALSQLVGDEGKVFALEADPENARQLHANMALNSVENVVSYEAVAGARTGLYAYRRVFKRYDRLRHMQQMRYKGLERRDEAKAASDKYAEALTWTIDEAENGQARNALRADVVIVDVTGVPVNVLMGAIRQLDGSPSTTFVVDMSDVETTTEANYVRHLLLPSRLAGQVRVEDDVAGWLVRRAVEKEGGRADL